MRHFIERKGTSANVRDNDGWAPLHHAAKSNSNVEVLDYLVSQGADVNAKSNTGRTPLHAAAQSNINVEVLKFFVSQGANVSARNNTGETPLHDAVAKNGNVEVSRFLISQGADVNARGEDGVTPIYSAVGQGNIGVIKYLISAGADTNAKVSNGGTPLFMSVAADNIESAQLLLSAGANINAQTDVGQTPLDMAIFCGKIEFVKFFISAGADINSKAKAGHTPLYMAVVVAETQNAELAKLLISAGADVNTRYENGETLLHAVAFLGSTNWVNMLLSGGADVNAKDDRGITPLQKILNKILLEQKDFEVGKLLITAGVNDEQLVQEFHRRMEEKKKREREALEYRAEQERREKAERERRQAEEAEQWKRQRKVEEAKERRYKIGRVAAVLLAALSIIMGFIAYSFDPGWSVFIAILITIYTIPFLVLFFSDEYSKAQRIGFLVVCILLNLLVLRLISEMYWGTERLIYVAMIISNFLSCIIAMIFPKNYLRDYKIGGFATAIIILVVSIVVLISINNRANREQATTQIPTPTIVRPAIYATVTATVLNVRAGPSTNYSIQNRLYENTRVEILGWVDDVWVRIRVMSFIRENASQSTSRTPEY